MEYIKNESGDVKVMDEKGNIKWFPQKIAENAPLMKYRRFSIVPKPVVLDDNNESNGAEASEAKRRGKPTK